VDVKEAYSIAFSVPSFYHRMEINIVDLEDVRANVIDAENLQFAELEMIDHLGDTVTGFRNGDLNSDVLAEELTRVYDSVFWLATLVRGNFEEVDKQLDTLTRRNARGLKI